MVSGLEGARSNTEEESPLRINDIRQQTLSKRRNSEFKMNTRKSNFQPYSACSDPSAEVPSATLTTVIFSSTSPKLCTDVIPSYSFAFCTFVLLRQNLLISVV